MTPGSLDETLRWAIVGGTLTIAFSYLLWQYINGGPR